MKLLLCLSTVLLGARLSVVGADSADLAGTVSPEHWAFQAPKRAALPPHSLQGNPIDAFITVELEKHGLTANPPARKDVLLRRVYIDLMGLPPTRDELHAFLTDPAADAYEKVVDRLLASPQHAERWARHWMDIWRYADWYGRRHVPDVWNSAPQVWRWRDWIVRSLAADKGYDRMVLEMLAGDEVAPEDDRIRVATGYLVRNWYALNPNQWMRDTVEHTGKAFLGLTFNCAHCHDHKYDPITQRDYFQFRAFFEPIQVRQDWVKGESDPGPFQKYEYSATRKVVTNGLVSVFDENLEAKTFIYLRGDERSLPEGKPTVEPVMPAFLRGPAVSPHRIDLPPIAQYPGLKPFIQAAEINKRQRAREAAQEACATASQALAEAHARFLAAESTNDLSARGKVFADRLTAEVTWRGKSNQLAMADAELDAIRARIAADAAQYAKERPQPAVGSTESEAAAASRAERLVTLRKAEAKLAEAEAALSLWQAEQSIASARRSAQGTSQKKEERDQAEAALKTSQEQIKASRKELEAAQVACQTNRTEYSRLTPIYPAQSTGRRLALATWIGSRENPLTARVAVNHIWARHFHAPLVASVFDFGRNGTQPTHPALLDWLAIEFMEKGWSMKHLHRLMVTSQAYRRASHAARADTAAAQAQSAAIDPENRWLWRMNAGQMEAEVVRDSILQLAGALDPTPVGYPLPNNIAETNGHRSLYFECFPEPTGASQFAELFDTPNPNECYRRTQTIVPQQALALANSQLSTERSRALAQRLISRLPPVNASDGSDGSDASDASDFITAAYEHILSRPPTEPELAACREFFVKQSAATKPDAARASLVHALFNHNDFVAVR